MLLATGHATKSLLRWFFKPRRRRAISSTLRSSRPRRREAKASRRAIKGRDPQEGRSRLKPGPRETEGLNSRDDKGNKAEKNPLLSLWTDRCGAGPKIPFSRSATASARGARTGALTSRIEKSRRSSSELGAKITDQVRQGKDSAIARRHGSDARGRNFPAQGPRMIARHPQGHPAPVVLVNQAVPPIPSVDAATPEWKLPACRPAPVSPSELLAQQLSATALLAVSRSR